MTPDRDRLPESIPDNDPTQNQNSELRPGYLTVIDLGTGRTHNFAQRGRYVGKYFAVGIGGFVGSIARFWLATYVGQRMGTRFPYGTFLINVSGCFLIGLVMTILTERTHLNPTYLYLIPIGFIGGYTTFSTFEYETLRAIQDGQFTIGLLNIVLSVVVGFVMVWTGALVGKAVV